MAKRQSSLENFFTKRTRNEGKFGEFHLTFHSLKVQSAFDVFLHDTNVYFLCRQKELKSLKTQAMLALVRFKFLNLNFNSRQVWCVCQNSGKAHLTHC